MKKKIIALLTGALLMLAVPAFAADSDSAPADNGWGCWRNNTHCPYGPEDNRGDSYCGGGQRGWHHRQ